MDEFSKLCWKCGEPQIFKNKHFLDRSVKKESVCRSCSMKGNTHVRGKKFADIDGETRKLMEEAKLSSEFTRSCPRCGKPRFFKSIENLIASIRSNTVCKSCSMKGNQHLKNKKLPDKARAKMRVSALKRVLKLTKGCISFNPFACRVFDSINKELGLNGQHALNGGEKVIEGFSMDYYCEVTELDCVLIMEWDEEWHLSKSNTDKDIRRQRIIEESVGDRCVFLRWDQKNNDWRTIDANPL